jgi:hypothetical protein
LRCLLLERPHATPAEAGEDALNVLAGAEAVDAMVDAAAGVPRRGEIADLHLIDAAALGLHTKRTKDGVCRLQRFDRDDLGAATPTPELDLVLVARIPPLRRRRPLKDGPRAPSATCARYLAASAGRQAQARRICVHTGRLEAARRSINRNVPRLEPAPSAGAVTGMVS